ncbi:MAG: FAD-dependent oxidoreductase [Candidatus Omnitrophica bacterium]|nr:FAD-dependent oxidoreductase [Candidatus Omnitrophota bacterium]MDD5487690.1 FAD-dependent oxidoreductase [Candidatus Omnitrophota bacterium]
MSRVRDLIIIGAGPAGITAAVYAARKRMDFVVITLDIGGQTAWSGDIENYTGYQFISGTDLAAKFEEHARKYDVDIHMPESVSDISSGDRVVTVRSDKGEYSARTLIIASGKHSRKLGVPGEEKYRNKGVAYCATCDGPIFSGKKVVVVGGGNSGLEAVLQLVRIASEVTIVNVAPALTGDAILKEKIEADGRIKVMNRSVVKEIKGDRFVTGILVDVSGKEEEVPAEGVFVEVGLTPNAEFAGIVGKNELGEIKINCACETDIPGIFAAGDVTNVPEKQIVIAAGEGAKAALGAFRYVSRMKG